MRQAIDRFLHRHDETYVMYDFLKTTESWTYQQHRDYQLKAVADLWEHATHHVPYYKRIAEALQLYQITTWEDFERIPILTKDIVRQNFDDLLADNLPKSRFVKNSTSGSSGSNFYFYSDSEQAAVQNAYNMYKFNVMGLDYFRCRKMSIWGASFDVNKAKSSWKSRAMLRLKNLIAISEYELSEEKMAEIVKLIQKKRPKVLQSYPSIFMHLALYVQKEGLTVQIPCMYTGGEKLFPDQRQTVETVLHGKLYDFYGARDMPSIGMSCQKSNKIHVFQENVIFEVVDMEGVRMDCGTGDIIVTNLHNYVMPFFRYQIGDQAQVHPHDSVCACGNDSQIVDEIIGRKFEIITFPNGNSVGGTFWTLLLRATKGIKDFQVIQNTRDSIDIYYVLDGFFEESFKQSIVEKIVEKGGSDVSITFHEVDCIAVTKAGKKQFVISKINK